MARAPPIPPTHQSHDLYCPHIPDHDGEDIYSRIGSAYLLVQRIAPIRTREIKILSDRATQAMIKLFSFIFCAFAMYYRPNYRRGNRT